ncbi:MAG: hypothetical protein AAGC47_13830, partial [Bacteroidota bacterium]
MKEIVQAHSWITKEGIRLQAIGDVVYVNSERYGMTIGDSSFTLLLSSINEDGEKSIQHVPLARYTATNDSVHLRFSWEEIPLSKKYSKRGLFGALRESLDSAVTFYNQEKRPELPD